MLAECPITEEVPHNAEQHTTDSKPPASQPHITFQERAEDEPRVGSDEWVAREFKRIRENMNLKNLRRPDFKPVDDTTDQAVPRGKSVPLDLTKVNIMRIEANQAAGNPTFLESPSTSTATETPLGTRTPNVLNVNLPDQSSHASPEPTAPNWSNAYLEKSVNKIELSLKQENVAEIQPDAHRVAFLKMKMVEAGQQAKLDSLRNDNIALEEKNSRAYNEIEQLRERLDEVEREFWAYKVKLQRIRQLLREEKQPFIAVFSIVLDLEEQVNRHVAKIQGNGNDIVTAPPADAVPEDVPEKTTQQRAFDAFSEFLRLSAESRQ